MVLKGASTNGKTKSGTGSLCIGTAIMIETALVYFSNFCTSKEHFNQNYEIYICTKEGSQTSEDSLEHCTISVTTGH